MTKIQSDAELDSHLADIEAAQSAAFSATGSYERVLNVPDAIIGYPTDISVSEYKGGGSGPDAGWANPGYMIVQKAIENGVTFHKITDKGSLGRSTNWFELTEEEDIPDDE